MSAAGFLTVMLPVDGTRAKAVIPRASTIARVSKTANNFLVVFIVQFLSFFFVFYIGI